MTACIDPDVLRIVVKTNDCAWLCRDDDGFDCLRECIKEKLARG